MSENLDHPAFSTPATQSYAVKWYVFPLVFFFLSILFFSDLLFYSSTQVLSGSKNDLFNYFIYLRQFGFSQLAQGNLPLWNPYVYSGQPYVGGLQSALFYPPNWMYLILPLQKALNMDLIFHVFIAGLTMCQWAHFRGLKVFSSITCGVLFMFCGAFFPHVFAGHLAPLAAMAWAPLILLSLDMIIRKPGAGPLVLGALALSMQFLAGYPQMVFFTGVAAAVYVGLHLATGRLGVKAIGIMVLMGLFTIGLCAVQLFSSMEMGKESLRTGGLAYEYASMFSFPFENFITLLTPGFFGLDQTSVYWGRWYFWEMCLFMGATGLILALTGLVYGPRQQTRFMGICLVACMVLAMGAHTPMYHFLHSHVPGFSLFRGQSKFIVCASLFLALLAGTGLDSLLDSRVRHAKIFAAIFLGTGIVCAFLGLFIKHGLPSGDTSSWHVFFNWVQSSGQTYLPLQMAQDTDFINETGTHAAKGLFVTAAILAVSALCIFLSGASKRAVHLLGVLAMAEVLVFAWCVRDSNDIRQTWFPALKEFGQTIGPNARVYSPVRPNSGVAHGLHNIWGYDPFMLKRYAEFVYLSQGLNPDKASYTMQFTRYNNLVRMLRCRYIIDYKDNNFSIVDAGPTLPRALVVPNAQVLPAREDIFAALSSPDFDPTQTVILESPPPFALGPGVKSKVLVKDLDTDTMLITADVDASSIILITDIYAKGWKATSAIPGRTDQYQVMPADYTFRAIPVDKGHHEIQLEYRPRAFIAGAWVSLTFLFLNTLIVLWLVFPLAGFGRASILNHRNCSDKTEKGPDHGKY